MYSLWLQAILIALGTLGIFYENAYSAELKGFAIDTRDKTVNISLFTDQKVSYTTEQQGKQFTIVLPDTQISKSQLENGLPIVIDNQNRFIGRAVPTEDGKVKVILPNLPASEYQVHIHQGNNTKSTAIATEQVIPHPAVKPHPDLASLTEIEHSLKRQSKTPRLALTSSPKPKAPALKLSPVQPETKGTIWNPYVYHPSDFKNETAQEPTLKAESSPQPEQKKAAAVSTLSMADTVSIAAPAVTPSLGNTSPDPLWYLHSLQGAAPSSENISNGLENAILNGTPPLSSANGASASKPANATGNKNNETAQLKQSVNSFFQALPKWLTISIGLFLGGIGLFTLIGAGVLLIVLFNQAKQSIASSAFKPLPLKKDEEKASPPPKERRPLKPYTSPKHSSQTPARANQNKPYTALFEDTPNIQAINYLKHSSPTVSQAVRTIGSLQSSPLSYFSATRTPLK